MKGLIKFHITEPDAEPRLMEKKIIDKFGSKRVSIVPVPEFSGEDEMAKAGCSFHCHIFEYTF